MRPLSLARRLLHTSTPAAHDLFQRRILNHLADTQPHLAVAADNVRVLQQPHKFYNSLLDLIHGARKSLFLSSLYIGGDEHGIFSALNDALDRNPDLTVHLQLDYNRSTRPGPDSPVNSLVHLLRKHPGRVDVRLFRSPKLRGVLRRIVPRRFDEGWGTWHVKCYGADDQIILSGANLNKSYFTNRQDRYLHFTRSPNLVDYCYNFLKIMGRFSYKLEPEEHDRYKLTWDNSDASEDAFTDAGHQAMTEFQRIQSLQHKKDTSTDTVVFPFIQSMPFRIREEEHTLIALLILLKQSLQAEPKKRPLVHMTTGYFSLYDDYQHFLIDSDADCKVLVSSPEANGFFGSAGISGLLPEAYVLMAKDFWDRMRKSKRDWTEHQRGIRIEEWWKKDWTYHAKGVWVSPTHSSAPYLTMFGSTNLSSRSVKLDTELNFIMHTDSPQLRAQLQNEVKDLFKSSMPITAQTWAGDSHRIRLLARTLVRLGVKDML